PRRDDRVIQQRDYSSQLEKSICIAEARSAVVSRAIPACSSKEPYSFRTRFEDEKRTNPEELIAAAYTFCLPWRRPSVCRPPVSRRRSSRPRAQLRLIKTGRHSH